MAASEWKMTLHDGTEMDGRIAIAEFETLKSLRQTHPESMKSFVDYAFGKSTDCPIDFAEAFLGTGSLSAEIVSLLKNSAQETSGGIELRSPFPATEQNLLVQRTAEANKPVFLDRLLDDETPGNLTDRSR
ncbi:MAG: hypothetical protein AAGG48_29320 [Planctomycetota bacterium]